MYTAKLHIYLIGFSQNSVALVSNIEPLPSFQHSIHASESIDASTISEADLILLRSNGPEAAQLVNSIVAQRKSGADIILVAPAETFAQLGEAACLLFDFWEAPLDDALLAFHFKKWQADRKLQTDLWQTDQFLNTTSGTKRTMASTRRSTTASAPPYARPKSKFKGKVMPTFGTWNTMIPPALNRRTRS